MVLPLTIGMEEELFLVDSQSKAIAAVMPANFLNECTKHHPNQIVSEFLTSQVELVSKPCDSIQQLRDELVMLRRTVIKVADEHGLAPLAASWKILSQPSLRRSSSCRSRFWSLVETRAYPNFID